MRGKRQDLVDRSLIGRMMLKFRHVSFVFSEMIDEKKTKIIDFKNQDMPIDLGSR